MDQARQGRHLRAFLCLWCVAAGAGVFSLAAYSNAPSRVDPQPLTWPADTRVPRVKDRPTLVLALHPRCVCSHATLEELARLRAQSPAPLRIEALVYEPDGAMSALWRESGLVAQARTIPGVTLVRDPLGAEARHFGLSISGQTALYAGTGELLFSGGITGARGHEGDNAGRTAILHILSGQRPVTAHTAVFGCSIRDGV